MAGEKRLYSFVEVDDRTPVQKLKISDQLRVLLKSMTYDAANELHNEDIVTQEYMQLRANLTDFLRRATEPIRDGRHSEVIVNVSTHFSPVFDEVINSHEIKDFFDGRMVYRKQYFEGNIDIKNAYLFARKVLDYYSGK